MGGSAEGLEALLRPASVAVIGASRQRVTIGSLLLHDILAAGFTGRVHVVHPDAARDGTPIQGQVPFATIGAVPGPVDLAVLAVPVAQVLPVARECAAAGVRALMVITAGFSETGPEGARLQDELLGVCRRAGMRLLGPNCMGVVNTDPTVQLSATFAPVIPPPGRVALVSQSGGLGVAAMSMAGELGLGLSVSIGNRADVSPNDVLTFLDEDDGTSVVLLYVESFGNPRSFARVARRVSRRTPVVAVKGGRSAAGALATASHTGALVAASEATVGALFRQAGIVRADSLEELLDVGALFANHPLPRGPRVGIVANAGGLGVLAADACETAGLSTPTFSPRLRAAVAAHRPEASTANPVDLLPGPPADVVEAVIRAIIDSGEVDAIVAIVVVPIAGGDPCVPRLMQLAREAPSGVPVVPVVVGPQATRAPRAEPPPPPRAGEASTPRAAQAPAPRAAQAPTPRASETSRALAVPPYAAPERAVHALGHAWGYRSWRDGEHGSVPRLHVDGAAVDGLISRALAGGQDWLEPDEVAGALAAYSIPMVTTCTVPTPAQAGVVAARLVVPVAVKAVVPGLVHKSDADAVLLDVAPTAVEEQAGRMLAALAAAGHAATGLVVQPMASPGVELIMGVVHDATFGPIVACGAGGVLTEVLGDVAIRLTPLTDVDAAAMLRELRTYRLLTGYRGSPPVDIPAVEDILLRIGRLADQHPQIAELDANPVLASPAGAVVLDARIRVAPPARSRSAFSGG